MSSDIESNEHNWEKEPVHRGPKKSELPSDFTVADLFSGPGGLSEGLEKVGFTSILGVDIHEPSIDTFSNNHPYAHTIKGDVSDITKTEEDNRNIVELAEDESYGGDTLLEEVIEESIGDNRLTLLTAGIPCQGFSIANKKQDDEDERNYLFEEFVRATRLLEPEYILIENVSTMKSAKDGEFVEAIEECLSRIGYNVEHKVLKAQNYGVPQNRECLFFIGSRDGSDIQWPSPTHTSPVTVGEALSDLDSLAAGESSESYHTSPSNSYQEKMRGDSEKGVTRHTAPNHRSKTIERIKNTEQGGPMYERFKQWIRLDETESSPTVLAGGIRPQFQFGHPTENRGLTVRERARLQSFPDDYEFEGGMTQGRVQTGMAVPPILAENLGKCVARMKIHKQSF